MKINIKEIILERYTPDQIITEAKHAGSVTLNYKLGNKYGYTKEQVAKNRSVFGQDLSWQRKKRDNERRLQNQNLEHSGRAEMHRLSANLHDNMARYASTNYNRLPITTTEKVLDKFGISPKLINPKLGINPTKFAEQPRFYPSVKQ